MFEKYVDKDLSKEIEGSVKCYKIYEIIQSDIKINSLIDQANRVAISRMNYNDHGKVHAKIVAVNALKILRILEAGGYNANIINEEIGNSEDVKTAVLLGGYLHDLGMSVTRKNHDMLGLILARPIIEKILNIVYKNETQKSERMLPIILESILCHLGNYQATSMEAKIIATSDGTDITKGRARIPFEIGRPDIHKFSAMSIEKVKIYEGKNKPVRILIEMTDPTGIFQVEETLLKKMRDVKFEDYIEVVVKIKGRQEIIY